MGLTFSANNTENIKNLNQVQNLRNGEPFPPRCLEIFQSIWSEEATRIALNRRGGTPFCDK